jgi:hypothetical protein
MHLLNWPRLKAPWGADTKAQDNATAAASAIAHKTDSSFWLPELGRTERDADFHLLWQHCMHSQILPDALKRMRRRNLEYLAAHSGDVFYVVEERIHGETAKPTQRQIIKQHNVKLQENAARATYELERRDRVRGVITTTFIAAAIGAVAGGLFASGIWP